MNKIKRSIIKASIEKVFQYASDYPKWREDYEGVSDFKPITEITRGNGAEYVYCRI